LLGSVTRSEQLGVESAVMGAQIEQLPDLAGYLKLASRPEWRRVRLQPLGTERSVGDREPAGTPLSALTIQQMRECATQDADGHEFS
jgi:hypothetical protein